MKQGPYALLGIGDDADEPTIKRAYARLLKLHRPDDDPEGFQRVNDAYQFCLRQVNGGDANAPQVIAPDGPAHVPETAPVAAFPLDIGTFIAALLDVSTTASGRELLRWLEAHPAFYSIGTRESFAPEIVNALLQEPALPPRHVAAILHFFGLDTATPARLWLEPSVSALERYAHMTLEDAEAIRKPYVESPPPSSVGSLGWSFGAAIWVSLLAMVSLARCSGEGP